MNVGILPVLLVAFSLLVAINVYDSYGISWDEANQREIGLVNAEYVLGKSDVLLTYKDRDYGPAFELFLLVAEKVANADSFREIFLVRHLVSHFFFILGGLFCFLLVKLLFNNKLLAVFSFLLWILMPVFYAHSFFNTKDIPFASMMMVAFYYSVLAWKRPTWFNYAVLALVFAILINMRLMGLILPFGFLGIGILKQITCEKPKVMKFSMIKKWAILFVAMFLFLYISWPFLWENPIGNFLTAFKNMAQFRWKGNVLFAGHIMPSDLIPWYYISTWFLIQTPVLYLLIGFLSLWIFGKKMLINYKTFFNDDKHLFFIFFTICFFVPLMVVIILKSTLYDGWRQMFFIYVPFLMMIVFSIDYLAKIKYGKSIYCLLSLYFVAVAVQMYQYHPYQHVYFNELVSVGSSSKMEAVFELDYWGTSYKEQLEYLECNFPNDTISLNFANKPGELNHRMLTESVRKRFVIANPENADYFLTNHRTGFKKMDGKSVYKVMVKNKRLGEILKIKKDE